MAHNVKDWRRFDSPNKQTEGLQGWQTVVEVLRGSERSDRPSKTGTRARRTVGAALIVC